MEVFLVYLQSFKFIEGDTISWEQPMKHLAKIKQLSAYKHSGFWHPMDTLRDKRYLENMWNTGKAKWQVWK